MKDLPVPAIIRVFTCKAFALPLAAFVLYRLLHLCGGSIFRIYLLLRQFSELTVKPTAIFGWKTESEDYILVE